MTGTWNHVSSPTWEGDDHDNTKWATEHCHLAHLYIHAHVREMSMRQQRVTNRCIVPLNTTKTTLRNWRICCYHFCFNYAMMYFCNILDARWSHRMWHAGYLGFFILRVSNEEPKVHIFFILIISMRKMTHKIVSVFIIYTIVCFALQKYFHHQ